MVFRRSRIFRFDKVFWKGGTEQHEPQFQTFEPQKYSSGLPKLLRDHSWVLSVISSSDWRTSFFSFLMFSGYFETRQPPDMSSTRVISEGSLCFLVEVGNNITVREDFEPSPYTPSLHITAMTR
jgi:hypothetical protein